MPIISVVTAIHPPSLQYLSEAYASLLAQELPDGWEWQWLIQEDGESGVVAQALPDDPRISFGSARSGGPGVARTAALARAVGNLVKNLDADDILTAGALTRDIETLIQRPNVGYVVSRVLDLLPDGSTVSWEHSDPHGGPISRESVLRSWQANDWLLPVHPVTICIRMRLLLALGGWMALPTAEDTGLLIAANVTSDGFFIAEPSLLYRKHPEQVTQQNYHTEDIERNGRRRLIAARGEALAALLKSSVVHPAPLRE